MPPRKRSNPRILPDYRPEPLRLAAVDYAPRPASASKDPALDPRSGYGYAAWSQPSKPLTGPEKLQTVGAVGTQIFQGLIQDIQYNIAEPEEWRGDNRWQTIAHMRRDGQCRAVRNVCVLPLLQATWSINPASESDEDVAIAQDVADNLLHGLQDGWHFFLRKFFTNRFEQGHYLGEKVWQADGNGVHLRKIAERPAPTIYRWFPNESDELDRVMQRVWILAANGVTGQWKFPVIAAEKLLVSTRNQAGNDFRGESLYYPMWVHWDIKHKLYLIDGIAAERNGMGVPTLEDPPIVRQQSDRDLAAQALEGFRVGEHAYMDIPSGYKFTLTGVTGAVRDIMPSIQHHDLLMARSALAHFINLDAYGQLTVSADAQTLFLSAEEADGDEGAEALNALIREWVDYNYEAVDRYPTVAVTGIGARDLDSSLRGIAALATAGLLTPNVETENALRDDLDMPFLPAAATPTAGGAISVDPESQGPAVLAPGSDAPATPALPGTTAKQDLAFRPFFSAGTLGPRAIHLSGKPLGHKSFTVRMSGSHDRAIGREFLARDPDGSEWFCLRRKVVPDPNRGADDFDPTDATIRGYEFVLWRLGDGGVSRKNCDQCRKMAAKGLMRLSELHIEPKSGDTWCRDDCSCELEFRRVAHVKVGSK